MKPRTAILLGALAAIPVAALIVSIGLLDHWFGE